MPEANKEVMEKIQEPTTTQVAESTSATGLPSGKPKKAKPSQEEIEAARKKKREEMPEGMSKSQWKKLLRQQKWEETKDEYRQKKKEKKKAAVKRRREALRNGDLDDELVQHYHQLKKARILPKKQIPSGVNILMDCEFDDLMTNKEIVSLSNQVTRSYLAKRHCEYEVGLTVTSFNKNLKNRFDSVISHYKQWQNIEFATNDHLEELLPTDPAELQKYVYLTADTDEIIQELEPGHTYIIGGIVDKNRHKELCLKKAQKLGLRVGKLPIDKYIEINGRQVLATSHVYELCCKWFELGKDWGKAFNEVLPPRKVGKAEVGEGDKEDGEEEDDEDEEQGEGEEEEILESENAEEEVQSN
jgi:tRNA (guanine9-N1)-methyltransferase